MEIKADETDNIRDREVLVTYREIAPRYKLDNTPLLDLSFLSGNPEVKILVKDESQNATASVKVRPALFNLLKARKKGKQEFLDASSGNYAKALMYLTFQLSYQCALFVPESASRTLRAYMAENNLGAKLFYSGIENSDDARKKAQQYSVQHPEVTYLDQYNNDGSWLCHYHFTAEEIMRQLGELKLTPTHFVAGIGSGGTLIGIGKKFKEQIDGVEIIGLESKLPHSIRGIRCLNPATIPKVYSDSKQLVNRVESIDPDEVASLKDSHVFNLTGNAGLSAYTNIYASIQLSQQLEKGVIITVIPDGGTL